MWRTTIAAGLVAAGCALVGGPASAQGLSPEAINAAEIKDGGKGKGVNPAIVKAQVLLDRSPFSPGVIDGHNGENVRMAIAAFQRANGLKESGALNEETWAKLTQTSGEPIVKDYTITEEDIKGPFVEKIPDKMEEQAKLERLAYTGPLEALAEKFHMDEDLLKALNPGKAFDKAGETIVVANVEHARKGKGNVTRIEVDKEAHALRAYGKDGKLVAFYPASIGSEEKPAPSGTFEVRTVALNPTYTYNPEYKFKGVEADKAFTIKPGPNNPVGAVWIDLTKEGYGIHGTPEPAKVGKTYSHGCVRLTNWDAQELAHMVEKGAKVEFRD